MKLLKGLLLTIFFLTPFFNASCASSMQTKVIDTGSQEPGALEVLAMGEEGASIYRSQFDNVEGNVTVIQDKTGIVQFIILAQRLEANFYTVSIENIEEKGVGVSLSQDTAYVHYGEFINESTLAPHSQTLLLWSPQPVRIYNDAGAFEVVLYEASASGEALVKRASSDALSIGE